MTHRSAAHEPDLENELVTRLKLDPEEAKELALAADSANSPKEVDAVLELANKLIDGSGVEAVNPENAWVSHYYQNIVALYVNTGDTYSTTLLYDTEEGIFMVTSWGDFLEAWELEHEEEEEEEEEVYEDEEEPEVEEEGEDAIMHSTDPRQTKLPIEGRAHTAGADTSGIDDFNTDQPYEYARNYALDGWLHEEDRLTQDLGYTLESHPELADRLRAEGVTPKLLAHSTSFLQHLKTGFEDALGNAPGTAAFDAVEKATQEWAATYEGHVAHLVDEAVAGGKLSAEEGKDVLATLLDGNHVWDVYLGDEGLADAVGENMDKWDDILDLLGIDKDDLEPHRGNSDTVSNGAYEAGMILAEEALVELITTFLDSQGSDPRFVDPAQTSLPIEGRVVAKQVARRRSRHTGSQDFAGPDEFERQLLETFTRGYCEAALWSTSDESNEQGGDPLNENYSSGDIAPETMAKMRADCKKFYAENYDDIQLLDQDPRSKQTSVEELAGFEFWLTRNGHGTGFWDVAMDEEARDRLTTAAGLFGEFDLIVGDDGQIHS